MLSSTSYEPKKEAAFLFPAQMHFRSTYTRRESPPISLESKGEEDVASVAKGQKRTHCRRKRERTTRGGVTNVRGGREEEILEWRENIHAEDRHEETTARRRLGCP